MAIADIVAPFGSRRIFLFLLFMSSIFHFFFEMHQFELLLAFIIGRVIIHHGACLWAESILAFCFQTVICSSFFSSAHFLQVFFSNNFSCEPKFGARIYGVLFIFITYT